MAKTKTKEEAPPPSLKTSEPPSARFLAFYRAAKVVAIAAGFVATMIGLMASIGALTDNGYARVIGALFLTFAVPLAIGDRFLPENDGERAKGIITDTMAVIWVVFGFVFATVANAGTRGMLTREGDRLQKGGFGTVAAAAYFLAGVQAQIPPSGAAPEPSASGTASASTDATATATATATAMATATATASATASASVAPKPPDAAEKTPAQIFKELAPAVVTIFVKGSAGEGGGTGFVIDKNGTIVTNHHVIDNGQYVKIKLFSGQAYTEVDLLDDDSTVDLAILKIDFARPSDGSPPSEPTVTTLGDSDKIQVGERAISIGNPLGLEHTLTDGLVSARRMYEGRPWIQMSVPVSPGNSGGPVFNTHGEVMGITTAQIGGMFGRAQNLNLAVPVNELKKMIKPEYPKKRRFGESANGGRW